MPKMGEKSCEQSYNFKFKDGDRDGCGDDKKQLRQSAGVLRAPPTGANSWDLSQGFVRITRVLPIPDASQPICDWAIITCIE